MMCVNKEDFSDRNRPVAWLLVCRESDVSRSDDSLWSSSKLASSVSAVAAPLAAVADVLVPSTSSLASPLNRARAGAAGSASCISPAHAQLAYRYDAFRRVVVAGNFYPGSPKHIACFFTTQSWNHSYREGTGNEELSHRICTLAYNDHQLPKLTPTSRLPSNINILCKENKYLRLM